MIKKKYLLFAFSLICSIEIHAENQHEFYEKTDTLTKSVVYADKIGMRSPGLTRIDSKNLLKEASFLSTPDIIKVLQNLPGVSSGVELLSGLYVHGGDGHDNLFLLDGVPLFNVAHIGGLFSSFNTDVIDYMDFYKAGFPPEYGGRLSSVVDVRTVDGSMEKSGGSVTMGLIDGRLHLHGPVIKNKLSYDIALRRSWLDVILSPLIRFSSAKDRGNYNFFDTNVNMAYKISDKDKINFRFFTGTDWANFQQFSKNIVSEDNYQMLSLKWGNLAVSAEWKRLLSDKSSLNLIAYHSIGYSDNGLKDRWYGSSGGKEPYSGTQTGIMSRVNATGLKLEFASSVSERHLIKAEAEFKNEVYNPSKFVNATFIDTDPISYSIKQRYVTNLASLSVSDRISYGQLKLNAGLRADLFFSGKTYFNIQPRLHATYDINEKISVRVSYDMMYQYSHLFSSILLDIPMNVWMPASGKIQPVKSNQIAAGVHLRPLPFMYFDIGGYYKTVDNYRMYHGIASLVPPIESWERSFFSGKGKSYGMETELGFQSNKFRADLYYTLSWNKRLFPEIYDAWFYDRLDNRHKLTLSCSYKCTDNLDFGAMWNFHTGNRVTMPEHIAGKTPLYSSPNNARMPAYHRLDLNMNYHKKTAKGNEHVWTVSIYNAYCHMNVFMMSFEFKDNAILPSAVTKGLIPIVPSFSYTYKFGKK